MARFDSAGERSRTRVAVGGSSRDRLYPRESPDRRSRSGRLARAERTARKPDNRALRERQLLDWGAVREHANDVITEFDVQPPDPETTASSLSGGNQQKFIVGREIGHDPDVIVASHPTRGVDIGSIEFIHNRLIELRDEGLAIVVVSSKLEEIQKLADRIAVMYEGAFIDIVGPDTVSEEELGLLMAGHRLESAAGEAETPIDEQGDANGAESSESDRGVQT